MPAGLNAAQSLPPLDLTIMKIEALTQTVLESSIPPRTNHNAKFTYPSRANAHKTRILLFSTRGAREHSYAAGIHFLPKRIL